MYRNNLLRQIPSKTFSSSCTLRALISLKICLEHHNVAFTFLTTANLQPHKGIEHDGVVLGRRVCHVEIASIRNVKKLLAVENQSENNGQLINCLP